MAQSGQNLWKQSLCCDIFGPVSRKAMLSKGILAGDRIHRSPERFQAGASEEKSHHLDTLEASVFSVSKDLNKHEKCGL